MNKTTLYFFFFLLHLDLGIGHNLQLSNRFTRVQMLGANAGTYRERKKSTNNNQHFLKVRTVHDGLTAVHLQVVVHQRLKSLRRGSITRVDNPSNQKK
jgi:hypothetical protein